MPRLAKRKHVETAPNQSIDSFTRISKAQTFHDASFKKLAAATEVTSRKRKATSIDQVGDPTLTRRTISFSPSSDEEDLQTSKRPCRRPEPRLNPVAVAAVKPGVKGKKTAKAVASRTAKAHKPVESTIIAKSKLQNDKTQTKIDAICRKHTANNSTQQCKDAESQSTDFPPHLVDLVGLHKSFLKTVVVQLAHLGSNVPIDFRSIVPHISRSWGKRQVTVEDIRRCIAIESCTQQDSVSPFIISDYGRGKVCIELNPRHDGSPINKERLCRQFGDNLRALCAERAVDEMTDVEGPLAGLSLAELPQADITSMDQGLKANPQFAKGLRVLSELKNDVVAKQQEKEKQQAVVANKNPMLNPDGTKMSVLDRLRLKQLAKADAPLPPTGPELQRRAALNRVADVAATISMLSLSNPLSLPRQAFTMTAIMEKLKDSLRMPISKEEGAMCIRTIANEVAPEWLRIVTIGGRDNVVVQRTCQPVDRVLEERVQKLMA